MKVGLLPHQLEFWNADEPMVLLSTGAGGGKTYALGALACRFARYLKPGAVVSGTIGQLRDGLIDCMLRNQDEWEVTITHVPSTRELRFEWPLSSGKHDRATCLALGAENYNKWRGPNWAWAIGDEIREWREEAFNVLMGRVRIGSRPVVRFGSTPNGFDWSYDVFVDEVRKNPELAKQRRLITGYSSFHNPYISRPSLDQLKGIYTETFYKQEVLGRFVMQGKGQVYQEFERAHHVTEAAEYRPGLPVYMAWDFGSVHGSLVLAQYRDDLDAFCAFDEVFTENTLTPKVAREAFKRWWLGEFPRGHGWKGKLNPVDRATQWLVTGDASGKRGGTTSNMTDWDAIREVFKERPQDYGRWLEQTQIRRDWAYKESIRLANPSRRDRYNRMNTCLKAANGKTRLYLHPRCAGLIRDLEQVVYKKGSTEVDKTNNELTHLSDALGYLLYQAYTKDMSLSFAM